MKNLKILLFIMLSLFTNIIYSQTEKDIIKLCTKELNMDAKKMKKYAIDMEEYLTLDSKNFIKNQIKDPQYSLLFNDYKKGAKNNQPLEQFKLGLSYGNGLGTKKDCFEQIYWYLKASENNCLEAQYTLGKLYCELPIYENEKGFFWIQNAAENNYAKAQNYLADHHLILKDTVKAIYWYERAAENKNFNAQYMLGQLYENKGGYLNLKKASYWYEIAFEDIHITKRSQLELMQNENLSINVGYSIKETIPQISEKELSAYRLVLYKKYNEGTFGYVEKERALYWLTKSSDNDLNSLKKLILTYQNGIETKVDLEKAFNYTRILAAKTNADEDYFNLGDLYLKGIGTKIDNEKACECFGKASNFFSVNIKADYSFGVCLLEGKFKEWINSGSRLEGLKKLKKAIEQNYPPAIKYYQEHNLEDLEKDLINQNKDYANAKRIEKERQDRDKILNEPEIIKNKSFIQELIPELQKTEQAVSQKIKENDAAFRGTTVEAEEAKAQRDAAFYAASDRLGFDTFNTSGTTSSSNSSSSNTSNNSSLSNGDNSSNSSSNSSSGNSDSKSKTASSNDTNTNNNNSGNTDSNSSSENSSTSRSSSSNSSSGTTLNNGSNGSNSSTTTSNNNSKSSRSVLTLTVVDNSKEIARQKEEKLRGAIIQKAQLRQLELDKENYDKEVKNATEQRLNIEKWNKEGEEMRKRPIKSNNVGANVIPK